ncbi:MAG TPA: EI24 domain-containing protein [Burkholderiaceae bacterium]|nr:EI24 domain-containing protein [Burkholderiaceae bacterium]
MKLLFDSFWRAVAYCLHPRVIMLSLLPLVLMAGLALGLGYFFWEPAIDAVRASFDSWAVLKTLTGWLDGVGLANLKTVLAPLVVVFLSTPLIVVLSLLLVAAFMTPAMLTLVASRRFPLLERKHGGSLVGSSFGALWATVAALLALLVSIPLWFVPPLVLIVPPLIWGWLTYRVMSYDVLAEHASADERRALVRRHRTTLLGMGVLTGYLGAAPSLVWASGALAIVFAPVLVPAAVWIYTLVFAFAALWFAHFALAALQALRREREPVEILPPVRGGMPEAELITDARLIPLPTSDRGGAPPSPSGSRP